MKNRYAKRVDKKHGPIRDRLREIPGMKVKDTSKVGDDFPDLMVGGMIFDSHEPACVLVEVKTKGRKRTKGQEEFKDEWYPYIPTIAVYNVSDILINIFHWPEDQAKSLDV